MRRALLGLWKPVWSGLANAIILIVTAAAIVGAGVLAWHLGVGEQFSEALSRVR